MVFSPSLADLPSRYSRSRKSAKSGSASNGLIGNPNAVQLAKVLELAEVALVLVLNLCTHAPGLQDCQAILPCPGSHTFLQLFGDTIDDPPGFRRLVRARASIQSSLLALLLLLKLRP